MKYSVLSDNGKARNYTRIQRISEIALLLVKAQWSCFYYLYKNVKNWYYHNKESTRYDEWIMSQKRNYRSHISPAILGHPENDTFYVS